jgi:DNA-binding NtrC family response regulator
MFLNFIGCQTKNQNLMGNGEKILVIGRHASMMRRVLDLLQLHGYNAIGKQENEEAIAAFKSEEFQVVIIGGGVDEESRELFHSEFSKINPQVKVINGHSQTVLSDLQKTFDK